MENDKLSDKEAQALLVIKEHEESQGAAITPAVFAKKMWPASEGHNRIQNVGRGGGRLAG